MEKVYNLLYRYQHYLLEVASFFLLLSVAVKFDRSSLELIWCDRSFIAFSDWSALHASFVQIDKRKLTRLSQQIKG